MKVPEKDIYPEITNIRDLVTEIFYKHRARGDLTVICGPISDESGLRNEYANKMLILGQMHANGYAPGLPEDIFNWLIHEPTLDRIEREQADSGSESNFSRSDFYGDILKDEGLGGDLIKKVNFLPGWSWCPKARALYRAAQDKRIKCAFYTERWAFACPQVTLDEMMDYDRKNIEQLHSQN